MRYMVLAPHFEKNLRKISRNGRAACFRLLPQNKVFTASDLTSSSAVCARRRPRRYSERPPLGIVPKPARNPFQVVPLLAIDCSFFVDTVRI